ncbi:hydroxymethylbilane synthase [Frateuria aurantia]
MSIPKLLRIATRKSLLALWQAEHVASLLREHYPELEVELVPLSTRGDEILDRSLASIGGKGLFLKELEVAMLEGRADLAVHSLKDMPVELDAGFSLAAVLPRADAADAFVSERYASLQELPAHARVGTSSLRRQALLRSLRPDLEVVDLRGNVITRLRKLEEGQYDAIILACAGLQRLELGQHIRARLDAPEWLPAPGQAAIGIEALSEAGEVLGCLAALDDAATHRRVSAERAMNLALGGSCSVPVGAWCVEAGDERLLLSGLVGDTASGRLIRAQLYGDASAPEALGEAVAEALLAQGASAFLTAD